MYSSISITLCIICISIHILYEGVTIDIRAGRILDLAMKYYELFFPPHLCICHRYSRCHIHSV